jgi:hypothetical protein
MMQISRTLLLTLAVAALPAAWGQTWDSSGNNLLSGTYYCRNL